MPVVLVCPPSNLGIFAPQLLPRPPYVNGSFERDSYVEDPGCCVNALFMKGQDASSSDVVGSRGVPTPNSKP